MQHHRTTINPSSRKPARNAVDPFAAQLANALNQARSIAGREFDLAHGWDDGGDTLSTFYAGWDAAAKFVTSSLADIDLLVANRGIESEAFRTAKHGATRYQGYADTAVDVFLRGWDALQDRVEGK
jgi:hypothetical protein